MSDKITRSKLSTSNTRLINLLIEKHVKQGKSTLVGVLEVTLFLKTQMRRIKIIFILEVEFACSSLQPCLQHIN